MIYLVMYYYCTIKYCYDRTLVCDYLTNGIQYHLIQNNKILCYRSQSCAYFIIPLLTKHQTTKMAEFGEDWTFYQGSNTTKVVVETSMLDYDYISQLQSTNQNRDILSAIVHALEYQIQEFGNFPHLLETAKQKLYSMMNDTERRRIDALKSKPSAIDIQQERLLLKQWADSTKNDECNNKIEIERILPAQECSCLTQLQALPIRGNQLTTATSKTNVKDELISISTNARSCPPKAIRKENISNRDYFQAWDKFDVDSALIDNEVDKAEVMPTYQTKSESTDARLMRELQYLQEDLEVNNLTVSERMHLSQLERRKGNEYYRCNEDENAVSCYSKSLAYDETNAVSYANRAMASIHLNNYEQAYSDCCKTLELDPSYTKALARRAMIHHANGRYNEATKDYHICVDREPNNMEYIRRYNKSRTKLTESVGYQNSSKATRDDTGKQLKPEECVSPTDFYNYSKPS